MKRIYLILVAVIFTVYGCATPKIAEVQDTMVLSEPPIIEAPAPKPEPAIIDEIPQAKDRFSLSVRDADVRDVFLLLSKDSGTNIIADMDIKGNISIDFTDLDLNSALYAITRQLGYTFRMDKGFVRVCKPIMETRSFKINYITARRSSSSTMSASISGGGGTGGVTGATSNINLNVGGATGSSSDGSGSSSSSGQGSVNVTTSGTNDFWREVTRGLDVIIFGDAKGGSGSDSSYSRGDDKTGKKLVISELAGIVHVTDFSDNMEKIEDFLKDVEKSVRKQVMIQAHIIEVSLNDDYKFGINWDTLLQFPNNIDISLEQNLLVPLPTGTDSVFKASLTQDKLNAVLEAMKSQGQVNVLSSPKISTMNNQRAVIKLTTKEVSWVTNSFLNADGTILLSYTNPQIDEVGLFLDVTPQIDDNGLITMQIHPSISEKVGESRSPDEKSTKPIIDIRELDTMIKTKNGQTIVIAGLITDKIIDSTKKVPWLGDIPFLGHLFKQTIQESKKSELVILMTPYVLNDQSIEDIRKEHEERLRKAGRTFEPVPVLIR